MVSLSNVHKLYVTGQNSLHVLKGIDLDIEQGFDNAVVRVWEINSFKYSGNPG